MKNVVSTLSLLLLASLCWGQSFEYNIGVDYNFINSEYSKSHNYFEKSGTLNLVNFTFAMFILSLPSSVFPLNRTKVPSMPYGEAPYY